MLPLHTHKALANALRLSGENRVNEIRSDNNEPKSDCALGKTAVAAATVPSERDDAEREVTDSANHLLNKILHDHLKSAVAVA